MLHIRCIFLGFGSAARALAELLSRRESQLENSYGVRVSITGAVTANHGSFSVPQGLGVDQVMREYARAGDFTGLPGSVGSTLELIRTCPADVVFEMTPLDPRSGQPALEHARTALRSAKHVISANKGPVAFGLRELRELSEQTGRAFLYETSVMDGAPVFNLVQSCLRGCTITGFEGVLNSTTNFILDEMIGGADFPSALACAQGMGFAESDPSIDIEGWDSACKTAALMNALMDADVRPGEIPRQGIDGVDAELASRARERGRRLRQLCRGRLVEGAARGDVALAEVGENSDLGRIRGTTSLLRICTDLMGDITVIEHEPRIEQTAYGLYSDLLRLIEEVGLT